MIARFAVLFLLLMASLGTLFQTSAQPPTATPQFAITIPMARLEVTEEAMLPRDMLLELAFAAAHERGMTAAYKHEATFMPVSAWELTCRGYYANPDQPVFVIAFDGDKDMTLTMDVATGEVITYVEFYLIPRHSRDCTRRAAPTWTATPTAAISPQQPELITEAQNILRERGLATIDMASFAMLKISEWRPTCHLTAALENPDQEVFVFAGKGYPLWRYTHVATMPAPGQPTATTVFSEMTVAIDIETYEILALDVRYIDPRVDENLGCLSESGRPTP